MRFSVSIRNSSKENIPQLQGRISNRDRIPHPGCFSLLRRDALLFGAAERRKNRARKMSRKSAAAYADQDCSASCQMRRSAAALVCSPPPCSHVFRGNICSSYWPGRGSSAINRLYKLITRPAQNYRGAPLRNTLPNNGRMSYRGGEKRGSGRLPPL